MQVVQVVGDDEQVAHGNTHAEHVLDALFNAYPVWHTEQVFADEHVRQLATVHDIQVCALLVS